MMVWKNIFTFTLFLFLATLKAHTSAGQSPLVFKHLTVEDGLSSGSVLSIAQDKKGFLWVGTMDGLNRYDGKKIKIFKSFYNSNPIGSTVKISKLLVDKQENLWIGTNNGLYVYNSRLDSFQVFYHSSDKNSLCHNNIQALALDSKGIVWVGTQAGLNQIEQTKGFAFQCIPIAYTKNNLNFNNVQTVQEISSNRIAVGTTNGFVILSNNNSAKDWSPQNVLLKGNSVTSIVEDNNSTFWIGTDGAGLFKIEQDLATIKQFKRQTDIHAGPVSNVIRKLLIDKKGMIWIGTLKGLSLFYPNSENFEAYVHNPADERTLNFNSIYAIFEDRQGSIWVGTFFGGLNVAEAITTPFTVYQNEGKGKSVNSNIIGPVISDDYHNLWIGTEAEGLNYFDRKNNLFKYFNSDETKPNTLSSNLVKTLVNDKNGNIWVGMHSGGINVLNAAGRIVQKYNNKQGPNSINSNNVTRLLLDAQNRMWIGTEESGINIYDFKTNKIEKFETLYPNKTLPGQGITYLFEDSKSNLWIGTGKGLCMLSSDGKIWRTFLKKDYQNQLQSDVIYCITEDKKGIIWIGTYFGLSYYDPVKNLFHTYTTADGLAGNKVVGIVPDKHNNLWFSTNNGLGFLDSTRNHFHSFTVDDGLPGAYFNYNSFFRDENGHLFFGGYKGLVEFNPDEIVTNNEPPKVILTGLYINGHAVTPKDSTEILINDIAETEKILLDYDQNIVTVDFAVMNFIKPNKNKSAYKLEGYNTDWQYTDTHSASFTNLAHGSYRLLIRASNNDGVWNTTPLTLKITVLPPPWKTWWAYGLYILAFLLALFGIIYFFASRAALRRKLRYEHMVNVKQQELHQMKMDFFTHISHELRTPLTLIIGPLEVLMNTPNGKPSNPKLLQTIKANAERLLKLTNDLLDFRKAEAGHTELKIKSGNLVDFTRCVYDKFTEAAAKKSIAYKFENTEETIEVYFDPHHLEIVLTNLLSNAIKFTSFGGTISVTVNKNGNETAEIKVYDNGIGIPKEKQAKIFSNFYQADAGGIKNTGSGIGLAFSKSLIELHQGKLNFHSGINQQTGMQETSFIVILQLGRKHFSSENLLNE